MDNFKQAFEQFSNELSKHVNADDSIMTDEDKLTLGKIWHHTNNFVRRNNLSPKNVSEEEYGHVMAIENLGEVISQNPADLISFCKDCGISNDLIGVAAENIGFVLQNKNCHSPAMFFGESSGEDTVGDGTVYVPASKYLPSRTLDTNVPDFNTAMEEFGKDADRVESDLRWTIAVTILKYHKGVMDRLMHRRTAPENTLRIPIIGGEVFDLSETNRGLNNTRQVDNVGVPFIDLYKNPNLVDSTPKKIIPLKINDNDGVLQDDGILKFGKDIAMLDLSMKDQVGYDALDYTDMVASGVKFGKYFVTLRQDNESDPAVNEKFTFDFSHRPSATFHFPAQTRHSQDRKCNLDEAVVLNSESETSEGSVTSILSAFSGDYVVDLEIKIDGEINLSTGLTNCRQSPKLVLRHKNGGDIPTAVKDEFNKLTVVQDESFYDLGAYYSEENVRKSSTVIKAVRGQLAYQIPLSKNILVDFSIQEQRPEVAMDLVAEALSIGNDARGVSIMLDSIQSIHDRIKDEEANNVNNNQRSGVRYDYAAGLRVNPQIHISEFNVLSHTDSTRTGQILGDIRSALDKYLLEVTSDMHSKSLYPNALNPGEKVVYRIVTSNIIKENIFQVPHYHNHLNVDGAQNGGDVEYVRVLPSGVILEIFTVPWAFMQDKMLMVPFRKSSPKEVTNFGFNADRGTFTANVNVSTQGANYRRVISNSREIPIVTNPMGALITVSNLSELFDGNLHIVNP